eukprot:SAG31_NODE_1639_length_7669_cov_13.434082_3_plen_77_part_00
MPYLEAILATAGSDIIVVHIFEVFSVEYVSQLVSPFPGEPRLNVSVDDGQARATKLHHGPFRQSTFEDLLHPQTHP